MAGPIEQHFFELRSTLHISGSSGEDPSVTRERMAGSSTSRRRGKDVSYVARAWSGAEDGQPAQVAQAAERALSVEQSDSAQALAEKLRTLLQPLPNAGVKVREVVRTVAGIGPSGYFHDVQRYALVELKRWAESKTGRAELQRELSFPDLATLEAQLSQLGSTWEALEPLVRARQSAVAAPSGVMPVVLPPGADAAVLFHELCGHPLELDVTGRDVSYLGRKRGERVASELVTVVDDPTGARPGLRYRVDDEGIAAARVELLRNGVVSGCLGSSIEAETFGETVNGHARRTDYRYPPLPRMAHTELAPQQGTFDALLAETGNGLCIRFLTPRHVDMLTGDFSFYVAEAQRIEGGKLGAFVGPCLLRGNGLTALRGIDAVGHDLETFFGLKGCGKLDHGPLPVSFGNPSLRVQGLEVTPWP